MRGCVRVPLVSGGSTGCGRAGANDYAAFLETLASPPGIILPWNGGGASSPASRRDVGRRQDLPRTNFRTKHGISLANERRSTLFLRLPPRSDILKSPVVVLKSLFFGMKSTSPAAENLSRCSDGENQTTAVRPLGIPRGRIF